VPSPQPTVIQARIEVHLPQPRQLGPAEQALHGTILTGLGL
jgi:hypothetical protein